MKDIYGSIIRETEAYLIVGYRTYRVFSSSVPLSGMTVDKAKNLTYNATDGKVTFKYSGIYQIRVYIHLSGGTSRSFVDLYFANGGTLCPTTVRSQDCQSLAIVGDPTYELNITVAVKAGAVMSTQIYTLSQTGILESSAYDDKFSGITIYKILEYPL